MSRRQVDGQLPEGYEKGKPSKLETDEKLAANICKMIRLGMKLEPAASLFDISYHDLRNWVINGRNDPSSLYGAFLRLVEKAVAENEARDLSVVDQAAIGRPAEYQMEPVLDKKTRRPIMLPDGKPLLQIARDKEGNPVVLRSEIRPDVKAAQWRLERRHRAKWMPSVQIETGLMEASNSSFEKPNEKQAITQEQYIEVQAKAMKLLERRKKFDTDAE